MADKTGPFSVPVSDTRFPWVGDSYRLTRLGHLGVSTRVSPFIWIFATTSIYCTTRRAAVGGPAVALVPLPSGTRFIGYDRDSEGAWSPAVPKDYSSPGTPHGGGVGCGSCSGGFE